MMLRRFNTNDFNMTQNTVFRYRLCFTIITVSLINSKDNKGMERACERNKGTSKFPLKKFR